MWANLTTHCLGVNELGGKQKEPKKRGDLRVRRVRREGRENDNLIYLNVVFTSEILFLG